MPRQSKNIEFLQTLRGQTGLNQAKFAKACGKQGPNMNAYLTGQSQPGKSVIKSCAQHLYEWAVKPLMEIQPIPDLKSLPKKAGLYILYDSAGNILYIGKATNFRREVQQTLERQIAALWLGPSKGKKKQHLRDVASLLSLYEIQSSRVRHNIEAMFLRAVGNQTHNSNIGKFR